MEKIESFDEFFNSPTVVKKTKKTKKTQKDWEDDGNRVTAPGLRPGAKNQKLRFDKSDYCECVDCKGTGELTIKMVVLNFGKKITEESTGEEFKQICPLCNGTGCITFETKRFIENLYCKCSKEKRNLYSSYYVPDNVDKDISKHHWRCNCCKKVTQIG